MSSVPRTRLKGCWLVPIGSCWHYLPKPCTGCDRELNYTTQKTSDQHRQGVDTRPQKQHLTPLTKGINGLATKIPTDARKKGKQNNHSAWEGIHIPSNVLPFLVSHVILLGHAQWNALDRHLLSASNNAARQESKFNIF